MVGGRTFAEAAKLAPSILFIDEIDSFPNRATLTHAWSDWEVQVVNALLELIDGGAGRNGVVVVGACNQAHLLEVLGALSTWLFGDASILK